MKNKDGHLEFGLLKKKILYDEWATMCLGQVFIDVDHRSTLL